MTTVHNASLEAGASSAELTVLPLTLHGVNAETDCLIQCKAATGKLFPMVRLAAGQSAIIYPTTATLVVKNIGTAAGCVQVTTADAPA